MSLEAKNLIDYFSVCGLDIKSGLEPELNEVYGKCQLLKEFFCQNHQGNLPFEIMFEFQLKVSDYGFGLLVDFESVILLL